MLCHTMYKPLQHSHCDAPITRVGVMDGSWSTLRLGANPLKFRMHLIARYIQAVAPCRSNRCSLVGTGVPPQVEKYTTLSGPIFKPELLNNEEGTQHKTVLFRKALARRDGSNAAFGTLILSAVVFSGFQDSVQGGVISHVTYCCIKLNKTNLEVIRETLYMLMETAFSNAFHVAKRRVVFDVVHVCHTKTCCRTLLVLLHVG